MCGGVGIGVGGRGRGYRACSTPLLFSDSPNSLGLPECRTVTHVVCPVGLPVTQYLVPSHTALPFPAAARDS